MNVTAGFGITILGQLTHGLNDDILEQFRLPAPLLHQPFEIGPVGMQFQVVADT